MHRFLFALLLCVHPAFADPDMVQRLSGVYGDLHPVTSSCAGTFQHLIFSNRNQQGAIQVYSDNIGPGFVKALDLGFVVQRTTALGVEIQFKDEDIHTSSGAVVQWEFRPLTAPDRYCWHRTDWAADQCINTVQRCDDTVPTS